MFCILFFYISLQSAFANVELQVIEGSLAVCSGASVTLQCILGGDILTWTTPDGAINLVRGLHVMSSTESYHWQLLELDEDTLKSTLTFIVDEEIEIECTDGYNSSVIRTDIEDPPSAPDRPLTALDRIKRLNETFFAVSVVWNFPDSNNAHISSYVVTVSPPIAIVANGIISMDSPLFLMRKILLELRQGQEYDIRVQANSCDNAVEGAVSPALTINVQVPPPVERCTALPIYDYFSNNLLSIEIEWEPIPDALTTNSITNEIIAHVQSYYISVSPATDLTLPSINIALGTSVCGATMCKYTLINATEMTALYYSIFVSAKNTLSDGYSENKICNEKPISAKNDLLSLTLTERQDGIVQVSCRMLSRFEGIASCEIMYTIVPYANIFFDTSTSNGSARDIVPVILSLLFEPNTTIVLEANTIGGKQNVAVQGTLKTVGVQSQDNGIQCLYPQNMTNNIGVQQSQDNKSQCLYLQNETSTSNVVSEEHNMTSCLCQENETDIRINETSPESSCSINWVLATGIFLISFPVGIALGTAIIKLCKLKQKKPSSIPVYDYIDPKDNVISIGNNKCYMINMTPKLPQSRETK